MTPRILFLVNGLGLGNSTRCHAVMQRLTARGAEIEVVTSDNGLWYFADAPQVSRITPIPSLHYGATGGRISILRTLGQVNRLWATVKQAESTLAEVIARFRPDAVVTDSVYAMGPVRRAGLPMVALNNADMVMRGMMAFHDWPADVLAQFLCVEMADYLFHRFLPDLVISPRLAPLDRRGAARLRAVGPIVREDCQLARPLADPPTRVVIMLSGSVFGSPVILKNPHPGIEIDVIGRPQPATGPASQGVTYHGKLRDSLGLARRADLVMVNGGFSAVSEALVLGKPMVVIPVPHHAEQWVNARTIQKLGIGLIGSEPALEEIMEEALASIARLRAARAALPPLTDGAAEAAGMIHRLAAGLAP